jgi:hypothetical protein
MGCIGCAIPGIAGAILAHMGRFWQVKQVMILGVASFSLRLDSSVASVTRQPLSAFYSLPKEPNPLEEPEASECCSVIG